jgi:hypothetical protein
VGARNIKVRTACKCVGFEVLMVRREINILWNITPCRLVGVLSSKFRTNNKQTGPVSFLGSIHIHEDIGSMFLLNVSRLLPTTWWHIFSACKEYAKQKISSFCVVPEDLTDVRSPGADHRFSFKSSEHLNGIALGH